MFDELEIRAHAVSDCALMGKFGSDRDLLGRDPRQVRSAALSVTTHDDTIAEWSCICRFCRAGTVPLRLYGP